MKVLYYNRLSYDDCSIRVYRSFTTFFYKCFNIAINICFALPYYVGIMLKYFQSPIMLKITLV